MENRKHTIHLILGFATIYIFWGTTYLAIRFAIETIPPLLMAGIRTLIAGILLYGWCLLRFNVRPGLTDWRKTSIVGVLIFVGGNGGLTFAEQYIPSGLAALFVAIIPIWLILFNMIYTRVFRLDPLTITGVLLGLTGVALLTGIDTSAALRSVQHAGMFIPGVVVLLLASLSWSAGSLYSGKIRLTAPLQFNISMQMLTGSAVLILLGTLRGEWSHVALDHISLRSFLSMLYLVFFGSLITYSVYIWLLRNSTPAKVGTYAFFNPLVAVFLGWLWGGETLTTRVLVSAVFILSSILMINKNN